MKLHGDYLDSRIKNTSEELVAYSAPMNSLLDRSATGQRDFVWSSIGRAAWDGEHRDAILASFEEPDTRRRLLDAGIARGDDQFLSLALESIRRLMGSSDGSATWGAGDAIPESHQGRLRQKGLNRSGFVGGSNFQIGWGPYEQDDEQILS